jgi:hypothetical protein
MVADPDFRDHSVLETNPRAGVDHLLKSKGAVEGTGQFNPICFPAPPQFLELNQATLAQLVERLIRNQQVSGSSPEGGSIFSIT